LPGFLACDSNNSNSTEVDAITLVAVDPNDFPAETNCAELDDGSLPGGAYVAELIDVTGIVEESGKSVEEFSVQSSKAIRCGNPVGFAKAFENRSYVVQVQYYADVDGDPSTIDVCTVEGTSVTVQGLGNGKCPRAFDDATLTLATPSLEFRCYGWAIEPTLTGNTKKDSSEDPKPLSELEGAPAVAFDKRTVYARHCIQE
jgi:hypothetical protein